MILAWAVGGRRVVAACDEAAERAGVRVGLSVGEACALAGGGRGFRVEEAEPARDAAALAALAVWAQRFAPLVSVDAPDGLRLDVGGCGPVFGGEERLARAVWAALRRRGVRARVAVAPSYGAAWALARYGRGPVSVLEGGEPGRQRVRAALGPLPVAGLRVGPETAASLAEVGVVSIDDLLALPRATLPVRFGDGLVRRLEEALGERDEPHEPVRAPRTPRVEMAFAGPTTDMAGVREAARVLLGRLVESLGRRGLGVTRLEVTLDRGRAGALGLTLTLGRASGSASHLWALLSPRLERAPRGAGVGGAVKPGEACVEGIAVAGIEGVALSATGTGRLTERQASRWRGEEGRTERAAATAAVLDTLRNRLGPERVLRAALRAAHLPEEACVLTATGEAGSECVRARVKPGDRPPVVLMVPREVAVMALTPDGPVGSVRALEGRGGDGVTVPRAEAVTGCVGPERLAGPWWRDEGPGVGGAGGAGAGAGGWRDYYRVRDATGRWRWVFRDGSSGRWFVHGVWA